MFLAVGNRSNEQMFRGTTEVDSFGYVEEYLRCLGQQHDAADVDTIIKFFKDEHEGLEFTN